MARTDKRSNRPVVVLVRREEAQAAARHGGAWKVAYADFVTAMMAFFLLMWLLNATTEEQRRGLADYFSPTSEISRNHAGSGLPFGGKTAFEDGTLITDLGAVRVITGPAPVADQDEDEDAETQARPRVYRRDGDEAPARQVDGDAQGGRRPGPDPDGEAERQAEAQARERQTLEKAAEEMRQAVQADPALAALGRQVAIDLTPEGLRVQIMDDDRQPMFATGSAAPNERARLLLQKIGPVLARLPEDVSFAGHTDAAPFPGPERTNWELSAERANATRRLLVDAGLAPARVREVVGDADRDPLLPGDPLAAANRRIAIMVLRQAARPAPADPR